ncbi:MAG: antibiotic biosynthesis monooxygenase [Solimonas sp.]
MTLTHLAFVLAKSDCEAALASLLAELAAAASEEPGCAEFAIHQSSDDPALWFICSSWQSAEALDAHLARGAGRRFVDAVDGLLDEAMDVRSFVRRRPVRAGALAIAA